MLGCIVECKLGNLSGLDLSNDLEAFHHTLDGLMLQGGILALRLLTDHHGVNVGVPGIDTRKGPDLKELL